MALRVFPTAVDLRNWKDTSGHPDITLAVLRTLTASSLAAQIPANARMRFLCYVGGIGIRTLSVLGFIAFIRQSPEFERLFEAAKDLVGEFYKMIGL